MLIGLPGYGEDPDLGALLGPGAEVHASDARTVDTMTVPFPVDIVRPSPSRG